MDYSKYTKLFSPICIGTKQFENRIFQNEDDSREINLESLAPNLLFATEENLLNQLSTKDMQMIPEIYASAAKASLDKGYQICIINGSFDTFIGQSLSRALNKRQDHWNGTLTARMHLVISVIDRIREVIGDHMLIEFRMNGSEFIKNGYTIDDGIEIAKYLDNKVDIIYVSSGIDHKKDIFSQKYPAIQLTHASNLHLAAAIKKNVTSFVATLGGLNDLKMMNDIIVAGIADIIYSDIVLS